MNKVFTSLIAAACLCAGPAFSQSIILKVPCTISNPGTYVLGKSVTFSGSGQASATNAAIQINATNVVLDLLGNTISTSTGSGATGIVVNNSQTNSTYYVQDVTIQNGTINGFDTGISFTNPGGNALEGSVIQNLTVTANVVGVDIRTCDATVVRNNQIIASTTGNFGINANSDEHIFSAGFGNVVSNNIISGFSTGVYSYSANYYYGNTLVNCATGIFMGFLEKYRLNMAIDCTTPFTGGTALTTDNN